MEAVKKRKASIAAVESHLQQVVELAMSVLTVEADRALAPVLLDTESKDPSNLEVVNMFGDFGAPSTNLEATATKMIAALEANLDNLHSTRYSHTASHSGPFCATNFYL